MKPKNTEQLVLWAEDALPLNMPAREAIATREHSAVALPVGLPVVQASGGLNFSEDKLNSPMVAFEYAPEPALCAGSVMLQPSERWTPDKHGPGYPVTLDSGISLIYRIMADDIEIAQPDVARAILEEFGPDTAWTHLWLLAHVEERHTRVLLPRMRLREILGCNRKPNDKGRHDLDELERDKKCRKALEHLRCFGMQLKLRGASKLSRLWHLAEVREEPFEDDEDISHLEPGWGWALVATLAEWADHWENPRQIWLPREVWRPLDLDRKGKDFRTPVGIAITILTGINMASGTTKWELSASEILRYAGYGSDYCPSTPQETNDLANQIRTACLAQSKLYRVTATLPVILVKRPRKYWKKPLDCSIKFEFQKHALTLAQHQDAVQQLEGDTVCKIIRDLGWQPVRLANFLGRSESFISMVLSGQRHLSIEDSGKLLEHFRREGPALSRWASDNRRSG